MLAGDDAIGEFIDNLNEELSWDVICLQEFCMARPAGMRIIKNHVIIIAESETRKCPAIVVHPRWVGSINEFSGNNAIARVDLKTPNKKL